MARAGSRTLRAMNLAVHWLQPSSPPWRRRRRAARPAAKRRPGEGAAGVVPRTERAATLAVARGAARGCAPAGDDLRPRRPRAARQRRRAGGVPRRRRSRRRASRWSSEVLGGAAVVDRGDRCRGARAPRWEVHLRAQADRRARRAGRRDGVGRLPRGAPAVLGGRLARAAHAAGRASSAWPRRSSCRRPRRSARRSSCRSRSRSTRCAA